MKYLTFLLTITLLNCINHKATFSNKVNESTTNWCPDNGTCTFEILTNKDLVLKFDEFGNSYYEILEGKQTVLKFEFVKNSDAKLQDSSYKETVLVALANLEKPFTAKDSDLKKYNAIYSRLCFCRGQTGSYAITVGNLVYNANDFEKHLKFTFQNKKVPQILTFVEASF